MGLEIILNLILVICLQMTLILSAPLQFPLLQPLHGTLQQQRLALQEQMFALQQFQALQSLRLPAVTNLNNPPILLIYPKADKDIKLKDKRHSESENNENDNDSIVIDAGNDDYHDVPNDAKGVKAVLLVPNARGIIGDIISGISFFPIEINVPDSIAFIYQWFSDLIAGWGSQQASSTQDVRSVLNFLRTKQEKPIMMIPLNPYL